MRLILSVCLVMVTIGSSVVSAASTVYTWTDKEGVKHFSDKPPQGAERTSAQGEIRAGELKVDKFNTMQPYVPPTTGTSTKDKVPVNENDEAADDNDKQGKAPADSATKR